MLTLSWFEIPSAMVIPAIVAAIRGYCHARQRITITFPGFTSAFWAAFILSVVLMLLALWMDFAGSSPHIDEFKYLLIPAIIGAFFVVFGTIPASLCYRITRRVFDRNCDDGHPGQSV
jgi:hypothetical protein